MIKFKEIIIMMNTKSSVAKIMVFGEILFENIEVLLSGGEWVGGRLYSSKFSLIGDRNRIMVISDRTIN